MAMLCAALHHEGLRSIAYSTELRSRAFIVCASQAEAKHPDKPVVYVAAAAQAGGLRLSGITLRPLFRRVRRGGMWASR